MSLSQKNLSSIQKAGQAVHGAREAIAATVRSQAENMVASVSSQPFGVESEQAIGRFKTLSRLSQGLVAVESQLQELYAMATELSNPASDVIVLPSTSKRKTLSNETAVDVVAKPAKATTKKTKSTKTAHKAAAPITLTANDSKLLQYLQGTLKANESTSVTGAAMATGSGLPLGSVGVSLKKILASGAVTQVGRGTYQLAATAMTPAVAATQDTEPAKKTNRTPAKKANAAKAVEPAVNAVKAKPARKAKVARTKKKKSVAAPNAESPAAEAAPL